MGKSLHNNQLRDIFINPSPAVFVFTTLIFTFTALYAYHCHQDDMAGRVYHVLWVIFGLLMAMTCIITSGDILTTALKVYLLLSGTVSSIQTTVIKSDFLTKVEPVMRSEKTKERFLERDDGKHRADHEDLIEVLVV